MVGNGNFGLICRQKTCCMRPTFPPTLTSIGVSREWARSGRQDQVLAWLEELVRVRPEEALLRRKLAEAYQQRGRVAEAIGQLDALGDAQIEAGNIPEAVITVRAILSLRPPNAEGYQELLRKLESGSV